MQEVTKVGGFLVYPQSGLLQQQPHASWDSPHSAAYAAEMPAKFASCMISLSVPFAMLSYETSKAMINIRYTAVFHVSP